MNMQITENIKTFRTARGFTQNDLAVLLSVSPQAVSRWENGQAFPDIGLLPELAKYLSVSIDELMGYDGQRLRLREELHQRLRARISDEAEARENELRLLDLYEELGQTDSIYLRGYFERLMSARRSEKFGAYIPEERVTAARQAIRDRIRSSNLYESVGLLHTVVSHEEEGKLGLWEDEYRLPEYIPINLRDALLFSRYAAEKDPDRLNRQKQQLLYGHIRSVLSDLTDDIPGDPKWERYMEARGLEGYRAALQTVGLYSARVDDIFISERILAEVRYARALLFFGHDEESLRYFALAGEHLRILSGLADGSTLYGSVPALNTVSIVLDADRKHMNCVRYVGGYQRSPRYDRIRTDERFVGFSEAVKSFFPEAPSRSFVLSEEASPMDPTWEMLSEKARAAIEGLSDGGAVVLLTARGNVYPLAFKDINASTDAEGAMKLFIELKKNDDTRIERIVYLWHNGGLDLPSYAFREALLKVDRRNLSAKMLLQGLRAPIVKTVQVTMPKWDKS